MFDRTRFPGRIIEPLARDLRGHLLLRMGDVRCAAPIEGEILDLEPEFRFQEKGMHVFFSYYDYTPFSPDDSKILAMRVAEHASPLRDVAELGYFDLREPRGEFHRFGESGSWCWQQGCRLTWFPGSSSSAVLFNVPTDNGYEAVIADIGSGAEIRRYVVPIYALDPNARFGYSLNFSRLQSMRPGYGYSNHADRFHGQSAPARDGVWLLDIETGEVELIVSLARLADWHPHSSMRGASHYLNHIMCNQDGSRVMFMHLWLDADGRRHNRLLTCNPDGSRLWRLVDSGRVSHSWWCSRSEVLAYSWEQTDGRYAYRMYVDQSEQVRIDSLAKLSQDSHPSLSPNGNWLVTDTYPDVCRRQWLMMQHRASGNLQVLGRHFSPSRYQGESRCDLHPRWNHRGDKLAIDSTLSGRRGLYVFDVSEITSRI